MFQPRLDMSIMNRKSKKQTKDFEGLRKFIGQFNINSQSNQNKLNFIYSRFNEIAETNYYIKPNKLICTVSLCRE